MPDVDYDFLARQHGGSVALPAALSADDQAFLSTLSPEKRALVEPLYRREAQTQSGAYSPQDAPQAAPAAAPAVDYDALASQHGGAVAPAPASGGFLSTVGDVLTGAAKGLGQTATNLGSLVHKIPGVDAAIDALYDKPGLSRSAFAAANEDLAPANTAQGIGKIGEQVGETFIPAGAIADAAKGLSFGGRVALEGAANAGMAAAQGGNPLVGGAIGAAIPGVGALAGKIAPALRGQAENGVMQALGPTAQRYKAMSERLVPEILKRGLRGSREALQTQAADAAADAGQQIDDAIQQYGDRSVGTRPIVSALEEAKSAFRTVSQQHISTVNPSTGAKVLSVTPDGTADVLHEFDPRAIQQLDSLKRVIEGLGPDARADQLIAVRRAWDGVVDQAGGYAHRAPGGIGLPLADQSEAWAKRQATTAIRQQLDAAVPELSPLNKEFSFWKGLNDVLTQSLQRTAPQKPGLALAATKAAGHVVGGVVGAGTGTGAIGAGIGAIAGGRLNAMIEKAFTSPSWKLASAGMKDRLATAIANNDMGGIATALGRITAVQASRVPAISAR